MRARLEEIWAQTTPAPAGEGELEVLVARVDSAAGEARGLRSVARRAILRLMRPFTHHQRELNRALAASAEQLMAEIDRLELEAAHTRAALLAEIRRLRS
jgi:hypothetical protein